MAEKRFRLKNAPLIHVLIQVMVDPYLNVGTRIPDLQEALRPLDFIDFQEAQRQHVNFDIEAGELQVGLTKQWYFYTRDRSTRLSVGQNSIVLQRTTHTNFAEMKDLMLKSIQKTSLVWPGGHQLRRRLGLRYVNLIIPKGEKNAPLDFVKPGFHGVRDMPGGNQDSFRKIESFIRFERGLIAVRYSDVPGQPHLPPGIDPVGMRQRLPAKGIRPFGILDIDRYEDAERDFDLGELDEDLGKFNKDAEQTFVASCTEEALNEWEIEYVD